MRLPERQSVTYVAMNFAKGAVNIMKNERFPRCTRCNRCEKHNHLCKGLMGQLSVSLVYPLVVDVVDLPAYYWLVNFAMEPHLLFQSCLQFHKLLIKLRRRVWRRKILLNVVWSSTKKFHLPLNPSTFFQRRVLKEIHFNSVSEEDISKKLDFGVVAGDGLANMAVVLKEFFVPLFDDDEDHET